MDICTTYSSPEQTGIGRDCSMTIILFYFVLFCLSSIGAMHPETALFLLPSCSNHISTHKATWSLISHVPLGGDSASLDLVTIVLSFPFLVRTKYYG